MIGPASAAAIKQSRASDGDGGSAGEALRQQQRSLAYAHAMAPKYNGLMLGAFVLRVMAILCYLAGIMSLIAELKKGTVDAVALLAPIGVVGGGALLHMLGEAALALRDIARNSYR